MCMGDLDAHVFDWRNYVRYGCGRNSYCDSGDSVAGASRMKRGLSSLPGRIVDRISP